MKNPAALTYDHIIATGGIGTGMFFQLNGNNTLGREESRLAKLLPYKDYCKQHIILHYISVLLRGQNNFQALAIGRVGNDDAGRNLVQQMRSAGINADFVKTDNEHATMFSVCYLYPDHSGGNITTDDSASSHVAPSDIDDFFSSFNRRGKEVVLAAPEVPVPTRIRLLEYGRKRRSLNVASIASAEVQEFTSLNGFQLTDMLFINLDEARMIAAEEESMSTEKIVDAAVQNIISHQQKIKIFITCGAEGVYVYDDGLLEFSKTLPANVISTAGAGDAFLAGTIVGICFGMPIMKGNNRNTKTATDIGLALAAASVTSPDTINSTISADFLRNLL